jgi:hypothetical protein
MPGTFSQQCSPLALAALAAQDPDWRPPGDDERLTGDEYARRYLLPLAESDLLDESIHTETTVLAVGVDQAALAAEAEKESDVLMADESMVDEDGPEDADDDTADATEDAEEVEAPRGPAFYLLIEDSDGERIVTADSVLDATGLAGPLMGLGPCGIAAVGERRAARHFDLGVPDILGRDRDRFAGRRVLIVGSGSDAAMNVIALCQLAAESGDTRIVWIEPPVVPGDAASEERGSRLQAARAAIAGRGEHVPSASIERIRYKKSDEQFTVRLNDDKRKRKFDRVLVNTPGQAVNLLVPTPSPPPRFHVLGARSQSDSESFTFAQGLNQIRQVFAILGGRAGLDLYATASVAR